MAASTLVMGVGSAVANYAAQGSAAKQQAEFQNRRYAQTAQASLAAYRRGVNQLLIRDSQEVSAFTREAETAKRAVGSQKATARSVMSAAGLAGNSVNQLLAEFDRLDADNELALGTNLSIRRQQLRESMEGLRADAQSRISAATPQPVSSPSPFALALDLGSAGLNAANAWKAWKPETPKVGSNT